MIVLRNGQTRKLTMEVLEAYFSLGHTKIKADRDLLKIMRMKSRDKSKLEQEVSALSSFTLDDIDKYRARASVSGVMGSYYNLTPADIDDAYKGHSRVLLDLGNLAIVSIRKAFDNKAVPFEYIEQATREETLRSVGL